MLFGPKKKAIDTSNPAPVEASFKTMPLIFYGGQDPLVYKPGAGVSQKPIKINGVAAAEKKFFKQENSQGFFSKKNWIIFGLIFLLVVGFISWYYLQDFYRSNSQKASLSKPDIVQPKEAAPESSAVVTTKEPDNPPLETSQQPEMPIVDTQSATSTQSPDATIPKVPSVSTDLQFPKISELDSVDFDSDSLTDAEEELFKTDSGKPDTDGDGYTDGQEVVHLHDPGRQSPAKLIDSGLIGEYSNPVWGYRFYYPLAWEPGTVDSLSNQVLVSSVGGDYVEIRSFKKNGSESLTEWFGREAKGEIYTDYSEIKNNFGLKGLKRADGLVAFFDTSTDVYAIIYKVAEENTAISFRHVMELILQSFRLKALPDNAAAQQILPKPPT